MTIYFILYHYSPRSRVDSGHIPGSGSGMKCCQRLPRYKIGSNDVPFVMNDTPLHSNQKKTRMYREATHLKCWNRPIIHLGLMVRRPRKKRKRKKSSCKSDCTKYMGEFTRQWAISLKRDMATLEGANSIGQLYFG